MIGRVATSLFLAISLADLAHSLPGRQALVARQSPSSNNYVYNTPTNDQPSTTAVLSLPASVTAKNNILSVTCNSTLDLCSVYDISSSLVTVIDGNSLTASVTSPCQGAGCPTSVPLLTTGTGFSPASSIGSSRAPYANGTDTSQTPAGPTGTGTGTGSISGTGVSSAEANSTTRITSRTTVSVTTYPASRPWSEWTTGAMGTGRGTGASSGFAASPTAAGPYSNQTSNGSTVVSPTPTFVASTFVSAGQTFTTEVPSYSRNYISTATYTFLGATIEIPIPESYTISLPTVNATTTSAALTTLTSQSSLAEDTGSTSFSKCFTTHSRRPTGTASVTAFNSTPTLVCWGFSCVNGDCSDYLTRYPIVDATSTSSAGASSANNTASPTESSWMYGGYTDTGIVSATPTSTLESDSTSQLWPSTNATRNPDAYTHTGTESTSSSATVDAITAESHSWATTTRTVMALQATTSSSYTYNGHAQQKRAIVKQNRDSQKQKKNEAVKFGVGLEKKVAEVVVMDKGIELGDK